jgi:hypothetical protein
MVSNTGKPNGEDPAIAEQTQRGEAFNVDWPFFRDNPDRSYRARLATTQYDGMCSPEPATDARL